MTESAYPVINDFARQYLMLREKEGRIYSDAAVSRLPEVSASDPLAGEWKLRSASCNGLVKYIRQKNDPSILEIGCGNGWLASQLAKATSGKVTGIDVNSVELEQARRVFTSQNNLSFELTEIEALETFAVDVIVFAASIQYFADLHKTIDVVMKCLKEGGEIHIIDTHFYRDEEVSAARQRSKDYFQKMGFTALSDCYFHHRLSELSGYRYELMNREPRLLTWMKGKSPFPWIRISSSI